MGRSIVVNCCEWEGSGIIYRSTKWSGMFVKNWLLGWRIVEGLSKPGVVRWVWYSVGGVGDLVRWISGGGVASHC